MKHRRLISGVLGVICAVELQLVSAQTQPCQLSNPVRPSQAERLQSLLKKESETLAYFQQLLPSIRCEYADQTGSEDCRSMVLNLEDDAKQTSADIAAYRSEKDSKPETLFDIYVSSESILQRIQILSIVDEYNGHVYRVPLADAYNHFVKLTGAWFTGEMREMIVTLRNGNSGTPDK